MKQRTGRRDLNLAGASPGDNRLEPVEQCGQIGPPDIAAVDDAERQHQSLRRLLQNVVDLLRRTNEIDVQVRRPGSAIAVLRLSPRPPK